MRGAGFSGLAMCHLERCCDGDILHNLKNRQFIQLERLGSCKINCLTIECEYRLSITEFSVSLRLLLENRPFPKTNRTTLDLHYLFFFSTAPQA